MMKTRAIILGLIGALILSACSTFQVTTDRNKDANFESVGTYQIRAIEGVEGFVAINDINKKRIEKGLMTELERKGMSGSESPDVYVDYALAIDVSRYYSSNTYTTGPYWGRRGFYGPGFGTTTITEHDVRKGRLVVEVRDGETEELLWYSVGSKTLSNNTKNMDKNIQTTLQKMMEEFPVNLKPVDQKEVKEVS